jgi:hypothetical protein
MHGMGRPQKDRIPASSVAVKCPNYVVGNEKMAAKEQQQQRKIGKQI